METFILGVYWHIEFLIQIIFKNVRKFLLSDLIVIQIIFEIHTEILALTWLITYVKFLKV